MNPGILVGAGFLLGSVGVKALTSERAKKVYVKGIVEGMRAKEGLQTMVDQARAEFDDLMAEAGYEKKSEEDGPSSESEGGCAKASGKGPLAAKAADSAIKADGMGKGSGKGGHCHGHGRAGK